MASLSPLFARQPILDTELNTVAYELLFRGGKQNSAQFLDGDQASSHVLIYAFGQNKVGDFIGKLPAFINFTPQLLLYPPPLSPEQLVIEVLETVETDQWVLDAVKKLKQQGYKIALDDFYLNKHTQQLIKYADIIKIDVLSVSDEKLVKYCKALKPLGKTLLAEKIETHEMLERCRSLGFSLFQGYFLHKPELVEGVKVSESKQAILKLLSTLMAQEDVHIDEVVSAIAADPRLSYRILRIVNSSAFTVPKEIHSINQAVTMLGLTKLRTWAAFLLMTADSDKPRALSLLSMTRAKLCEQIGLIIGDKKLAETAFTAGLMSTFDAFLDIPLPHLIAEIGLSKEISEGILSKQGMVGNILELVMSYETAAWNIVQKNRLLSTGKITSAQLNQSYMAATQWADKALDAF